MSWLERLKNLKGPSDHPTKPTKGGFVGFVGSMNGHIQKTEGDVLAASSPAPSPEHDLEPAPNPESWKELASAYHAHHFGCHHCQAAGRGWEYGLRCGVGAALWTAYADTADHPMQSKRHPAK